MRGFAAGSQLPVRPPTDEALGSQVVADARRIARWMSDRRTRRAELTPPSAPSVAEVADGPGPSHAFGFPIFVDLRGRTVFVAGAGREATAKSAAIAELGGRVVNWVGEEERRVEPPVGAGVETRRGPFATAMLDGVILAIVATADTATNRRIAVEARNRGILVNTMDDIPYCDWSAPAILRRGDLTVAIGTGGIAPAVAVRIRDRLADELGEEYGSLLELFGAVRPRIMAGGRPFADRRRLWYRLVDGPALGLLRAGRRATARDVVLEAIDEWEAS